MWTFRKISLEETVLNGVLFCMAYWLTAWAIRPDRPLNLLVVMLIAYHCPRFTITKDK